MGTRIGRGAQRTSCSSLRPFRAGSWWLVRVCLNQPRAQTRCFHFLTALSRKLGHVEYFSASRVVQHHCWVLLEKGPYLLRAYAWAGETLWNQGPVTAAEKDLEMLCLEYASEQSPFALREALSANCEKVNQLAARWSIDPGAIPPEMWGRRGIVGIPFPFQAALNLSFAFRDGSGYMPHLWRRRSWRSEGLPGMRR